MLVRNNNGEWVAEDSVLIVSNESAQKLENIARQCEVTLSRQTSMGIIWFYWYQLEKLTNSITDESLLEYCINIIDIEKFRENLTKAKRGDVDAQCHVGFCYRFGMGVEEDPWEAVNWFMKAAEQGHADAQFFLGDCYRDGEGVQKNDWLAIMWLKKAAEQGQEAAKGLLSNYDNTDVDDWLIAAERGEVDAQYSAGFCYYYGLGLPQDFEKSVCWLTKAAEQDDIDAQRLLVTCYLHGLGVSKDLDKAEMWLDILKKNTKP